MIPLTMLWLPILISAVLVFIAANILWMALPFWHHKDYVGLPEEKRVLEALSTAKSGQYVVPKLDWKTMTPEERTAMHAGPTAYMLVRNPATFSFGKLLGTYFLYMVVVAIFVAYITGRTRAAGAPYLEVFRIASTVGFLSFGLRGVSDSIWYGKPWKVTFKEMIDGLIYGLLMGGTFGWLWPR